METLFITIVNMSITATFMMVVVLVLRLPLRRTPRWLSYALWIPVMFRLVCPVSFSASFSVIGRLFSPPVSQGSIQYIPQDIGLLTMPQVDPGIPRVDPIINPTWTTEIMPVAVSPLQIISIGTWLWLAGFLVMVCFGVFSYVRLKRRIRTAVKVTGHIYESDEVASPFVCGFVKPAIYLPIGLEAPDKAYVLRHEQAHLERFDHLVKPLAYILLSIHWFNPLMWLAFHLMSRDIEICCDERAVRHLGRTETADYGRALVRLAIKRPLIPVSPLAFGESSIRGRLKNIMNIRRPTFWIVSVILILLVLAIIVLSANPLTRKMANLAVLDHFTSDLTLKHQDIVDMTDQYATKDPAINPAQIRLLACGDDQRAQIMAELADEGAVEDLVNERLSLINNPLVDFFRPVHLFINGNLVVQYIGDDDALLSSLTELLGQEWPHDAPFLKPPDFVSISTVSMVPLTNHDLTKESDLRMIQSIIALCDRSQHTWPGSPVNEMPDKTQIMVRQSPDSVYEQYTLFFDDTGSAFIISNQTGTYFQLDDARKTALLKFARAGFYENPVMTVRSGDNEIRALGHWVYSYHKITKVSADGRYLTAQNIKDYLTWLPIDFVKSANESTRALAINVNGREPSGDFIMYDHQMRQIFPAESGHAAMHHRLENLAPGQYVVELRTRRSSMINESGYQYFFGIIIK